jgi:hypothetical protein
VRLQRVAVAIEERGEGDLVGIHQRLRPRLPALLIGRRCQPSNNAGLDPHVATHLPLAKSRGRLLPLGER